MLVRLFVVLLPIAVAGAIAMPAGAEPCQDCGGGGGVGTVQRTYSNTLTVTRSAGTVTSSPSGIDCGSDCTHTETHTLFCDTLAECTEDHVSWSTYTLTASGGRAGFAPVWSGCAASGATCSVKLDDNKTVNLTWADVASPSVSITSPANGATVGAFMFVTATASDNDQVARVEFRVDDVLKATDANPPYSVSIGMSGYPDGSEHAVSLRAYDFAGNVTQSAGRTVTVDRHVSVSAGSLPAFTNAQTVPLTISTDSDAAMKCRLGDGTATPCAGSYSPVDADTPDGAYTYTVVATDGVGNTASLTRSFVLDRTPPAVTITDGPSEGQEVTTASATVSFEVSDANLDSLTCAIDGAAGPCTSDHSQVLQGLPAGDHTLTIAATDKAGNSTQRARTFSVRAAPSTTGGTTTGGGTTGGTATTQQPPPTLGPTALAPRLSFRARVRGRTTRLRRLSVRDLPVGAVVRITCRGHGCRHRHATLRAPEGGSLAVRRLLGRRLRAGTRLRFRIAAQGRPPQTLTLRVRKGRKPLVR